MTAESVMDRPTQDVVVAGAWTELVAAIWDRLDRAGWRRADADGTGLLHGLVVVGAAPSPLAASVAGADAWRDMLGSGVTFAYQETRRQMSRLRAGGAIVYVIADDGLRGQASAGVSSVVDAATVMLADVMTVEAAAAGVRVNLVAAGAHGALPPLRHATSPDEVAEAVAFLLGDGARGIAGAHLAVNGGMHATLRAAVRP